MMRSLSRLLAVVVVGLCSACAAKTRERAACEPVPPEFALPGRSVYRDCEVDKTARSVATSPVQYKPTAGQQCVRAVVEFVVDSTGRPLSSTARVVRTTDPSYAAAVVTSIEGLRYEPAMKDGRPVSQVVRIERATSVVTVLVPAGTPPGASMRPPRRPSC